MWRNFILIFCGVSCVIFPGFSQLQKHFAVEKTNNCEKLTFSFSTLSGTCYLSSRQQNQLINVYGTKDIEYYNHQLARKSDQNPCVIDLNVRKKEVESVGQSISLNVFQSNTKKDDNFWKIYASKDIPLELDLNYGLGKAYIDLSDLSVSKLKVNTGSADVNVGYLSEVPNRIDMDSILMQVDLGTLTCRNLSFARARNISANVGFGSLTLDLRDQSLIDSNVKASVGAGDLIVYVPASKTPMKVKVKASYLCKVALPPSFKEIKDNVWVNEAYTPYANNLVNFDVNVSLGTIIFREN